MPDSDPLKFLRRWSLVSIAMLVMGLLIAVPSGLCVGEAAYELYLNPNPSGRAIKAMRSLYWLSRG